MAVLDSRRDGEYIYLGRMVSEKGKFDEGEEPARPFPARVAYDTNTTSNLRKLNNEEVKCISVSVMIFYY
jgi:hypothetical protein